MKHSTFFLVAVGLLLAFSGCFADSREDLRAAVLAGEASEVKALVEAGANVNARYGSDYTAVMWKRS